MVGGRFFVGVAFAAPRLVELLRTAIGADVELIDVTRIRAPSSPVLDLVLVGPGQEWRAIDHVLAAGWPVVVLADTRDEAAEYGALEHGASGYIALSTPAATLRRTLRAALSGEPVFSRRVLGRWLRDDGRGPRERSAATHAGLTPRQQQILGMIAEGATTKEIAGRLRIKNSTVDKHISSLLKRVGVSNRAAAVGALGWSAVRSAGHRKTVELQDQIEEEEEEPASRA